MNEMAELWRSVVANLFMFVCRAMAWMRPTEMIALLDNSVDVEMDMAWHQIGWCLHLSVLEVIS